MEAPLKIVVPRLFELMKEKGIEYLPTFVGGIIPEKDELILREFGVKAVFHPITPLEMLVQLVKVTFEGKLQNNT